MQLRSVRKVETLAIIALTMIAVQTVNILSNYALNQYGVLPRTFSGLTNILFSPWIHASWQHLFNNLMPFLILSALIIHRSTPYYLVSSAIIITLSGLLIWMFGRSAYHIGASGWVFGLWALIVTNAFKRRQFSDIVIGIAVIFYYGTSIVTGLLPIDPHISFEGHIAGAIAGFSAAVILAKCISDSKKNTNQLRSP